MGQGDCPRYSPLAMRVVALLGLFVAACGGGRPMPAESRTDGSTPQQDPPDATAIEFPRAWEEWDDPKIGCVPHGEERSVRGTLRVEPFGKGTDGTQLVLEDGEVWIVDYGTNDELRQLEGRRLVARGRLCDKQLASIGRQHFDVRTLTVER